MANLVPITEFDLVFISYDEPNADENYADLIEKAPWALRSHGVWGSDAAHKAAAKLTETDRFITIDADNIVYDDFFNLEVDMDKISDVDVISWAGKNMVNGLVYGNGGIKCWPKLVVEQMRTHEAAPENDAASQVDFCWNIHYVQMNNIYCDVHNNGSPLQAWRAGFREGVKMTLSDGDVVAKQTIKKLNKSNYRRLLTWMSVGADAPNGLWAVYGARLGCAMTNVRRQDWDWKNVRDFDWLTQYFNEEVAPQFTGGDMMCARTGMEWDSTKLWKASADLGVEIRRELDLEIADLNAEGSRFFKQVYINPARVGAMVKEQDVINEIE